MTRISELVGCGVVVVILLLSTSTHADEKLANELKKLDIDQLKSQLPEGLIPHEFANISLPSLEEMQNIIRHKCSKVAGNEQAYEQTENAGQRLGDCLNELVDFSDIQSEIQKAKPTGDLDTVFNKYCKRRAAAIECVDTFSNDIEICLDDEERESKRIMVNLFHGLLNFVCHKDGDQIALFIAEEGPECFQEQRQPLMDCFNNTLQDYLEEPTPTKDQHSQQSIPKLVMGKKQCDDMDSLKECFVRVLEDCKESTPANLVESLFKFIRKETPCVNFTTPADPKQRRGSSADAPSYSVHIILATWLMALVAKSIVF